MGNRNRTSWKKTLGGLAIAVSGAWTATNAVGYPIMKSNFERMEQSEGRKSAVENARKYIDFHTPVSSIYLIGWKKGAESYVADVVEQEEKEN